MTLLPQSSSPCGGGGFSTGGNRPKPRGAMMTSTTSQASTQAMRLIAAASVPIVTSTPATSYAPGSQKTRSSQ